MKLCYSYCLGLHQSPGGSRHHGHPLFDHVYRVISIHVGDCWNSFLTKWCRPFFYGFFDGDVCRKNRNLDTM
ncbi:hypothetical protein YC2023_076901 [Brassica napus]